MKSTIDDSQNDSAKLRKLLEGIEIAMLTTREMNGEFHSRPMETQEMDEQGFLWFFTDVTSLKVSEIEQEAHVNLIYSEPKSQRYVSVCGNAAVVQDPIRMKELWKPAMKAFFPKGLEDPKLGLLKVSITSAEYWESPASTVVKLFGFAKALTTGKPFAEGEHGKMNFRPLF